MDISLHPMHVSHLSLAGRLKHCLAKWELITSDPWVLETITGLKLNFVSPLFQVACPQQAPQTEETKQLIYQLRDSGTVEKRGSTGCSPISGSPGIFEHPILSRQRRWWTEPSGQPSTSQPLPYLRALEDGGNSYAEGPFRKGDYLIKIDLRMHISQSPSLQNTRSM